MIDYEFYYDQYRRETRDSLANQKDLIDYRSTVSISVGNRWWQPVKQPIAIRYIDGSALLNLRPSPSTTKGLFPKGKCRRSPYVINENKSTDDTDRSSACKTKTSITRDCEKTPSSLTTEPKLPLKSVRNRLSSAVVLEDKNSAAKKYGRLATTFANGAWVRQQQSIRQSQLITSLLRGDEQLDKVLLRKRTCQQSSTFSASSNSSTASLLHKRRRD